MSFCFDIKNELSKIRPSDCCKLPLIYGFLLFSRSFCSEKICMQTENETAARLYQKLLKECYNADASIFEGGGKRKTYRAVVQSEFDRLKILASVDFGIYGGKINRESFRKECCAASFIRGAFLACGRICDPDVCYRVDFNIKEETAAQELKCLLSENFIDAHISKRGNIFTLYIKKREMIINLLTLIGASKRSLELIEKTILKDIKNNTNRARNCDSANINRTVEASIKQRRAIEYFIKTDRFESLPQELKDAAKLRINNPESSLNQLCLFSENPITVSGLNHRFNRLIQLYENSKK